MKKTLLLLLLFAILLVVGAIAIYTKPTDEQCVELVKDKVQAGIVEAGDNSPLNNLFTVLAGKAISQLPSLFRIEDNVFYKNIYFIPYNIKIGSAYFGTFTLDNNLANNINDIRSQIYNNNSNNRDVPQNTTMYNGEIANKRIGLKRVLRSFKRKETNSIGNDNNSIENDNNLENLEIQLSNAQVKLRELQKFHLLRTNSKKEDQINQQEQNIQSLEERINELKNNQVAN